MWDSTYSTSSDVASVFYYEGNVTTVGYCTLVVGVVATGGVLYYSG